MLELLLRRPFGATGRTELDARILLPLLGGHLLEAGSFGKELPRAVETVKVSGESALWRACRYDSSQQVL